MVTQVIDFSTVVSPSLQQKQQQRLNPLGLQLRRYILQQLKQGQADPAVTSFVLTGGCNHANFSAGADITEFAQFMNRNHDGGSEPNNCNSTLRHVVTAIQNSTKPVVACIQGHCLGGGLELALACHYRVAATTTTKLGLPEVHVGVIPGAGGTQLLPRLIGLTEACRLILTGAHINAQQALDLNLIDAIAQQGKQQQQQQPAGTEYNVLLETAQQWARWAEVMPIRRVDQMPLQESLIHAHVILHAAELQLPPIGTHGPQRAALEALRAVYTSATFEAGMQVEEELFLQTLLSEEGQARRHAFFAIRKAQKPVQLGENGHWKQQQHPVLATAAHAAVIGAGTLLLSVWFACGAM
jgi:3-hydroxyacyl-CoA dehydrogenase